MISKISMEQICRRELKGVLFCLMMTLPSFAQTQIEENRRFVLEPWRIKDSVVFIRYELVADKDSTYDVKIFLKRKSDPSYQRVPKSVSGAIGRGQFAGGKREIRWELRKDIPQGLIGNDYYFRLTAEVVPGEAGWPWWYYAAGGVAIGGIVAAVLSGSSETPPAATATMLPEPPGSRPNP